VLNKGAREEVKERKVGSDTPRTRKVMRKTNAQVMYLSAGGNRVIATLKTNPKLKSF